jgi:hypothetical protein
MVDGDSIFSLWNWLFFESEPRNFMERFLYLICFVPLLIIGMFQIAIFGGICLIIGIFYYLITGEYFIEP